MTKPKILVQFDPDVHASLFDAVVAIDTGVDQLIQYQRVESAQVRDLVHGAIFTRGPRDLHQTAIFIGGSNVATGEALLKQVVASFFGPLRVSVMLDSNGANTTAAAAVLAAEQHVVLRNAKATVLAATGPVGQRIVRLLAQAGSLVRLVSRSLDRAKAVCQEVNARYPDARLEPVTGLPSAQTDQVVADSELVFSAGAAGVELLSADALRRCETVKVAIDLNAVPPVGIGGIEPLDRSADHHGVLCYGALAVGGTKMKIHKRAIQQLFQKNDQILDAEEILTIGRLEFLKRET